MTRIRRSLLASFAALAVLPQGILYGQPARLAAPTATLDHEFTRIVGVRELGPDRVLVADAGEKSLVVAEWKGGARQLGRVGRGPAEYSSLNSLLRLAGDSTLLVDGTGFRWLLLAGDSIVTTLPPETPAISAGTRSLSGADTLGYVLTTRGFEGVPLRTSGSAVQTDSTMLIRVARRTGGSDTLATISMRPARVAIGGTTAADRTVSIIFNPLTSGEMGVLFPDGWTAIARLAPYRVDWAAPGRKPVAGAPLPFERITISDREKRAVLAVEARNRGTTPRDPAAVADWPEALPAFLIPALVAAENGHLWIRRTSSADHPESMYDVVDRSGTRVARFQLAANERVAAVTRLAVYTVLTDDDGIQRLRKHPLPRY